MNDYSEIKKKLLKRRDDLAPLLEKIEKSARRQLDKSYEEQTIQRENEEVLTALDESLNKESDQIQHALMRLENGEYGSCENCGEMIPEKRLDVLPHTNCCINCAAISETKL